MIGIFQDNIIDYLKDNLGGTVKTNSKNIICRCPWCENQKANSAHYHLWISIEFPIFHCFHCEKRGFVSSLFEKIEGKDKSDNFIDKTKIKDSVKRKVSFTKDVVVKKEILLPKINEEQFKLKTLYVKKRLAFSQPFISSLKGLVFDFYEFVRINNIKLDEKQSNMAQFLQSNFIGFVTENQSKIVFRNIDSSSGFRFYKIALQDSLFMDYYRLNGANRNSSNVIVAEGIFDVLAEQIFDYTKLRSSSRLYAAALSTSYKSLIESISFYEQLFRIDLHVLSDSNINIPLYRKLKQYYKHIINSITIYYNKKGKDFNVVPVEVSNYVI